MIGRGKRNIVRFLFLLGVSLLALRLFLLADAYAPVLIVMDRWHSMEPLFDGANLWEGFSFRHGPHRLGLIHILFKINALFSEWNSRWDMFAQLAFYIASAFLAFRLKVRLSGKMEWSDLLIPLIFLTPHSIGTFTVNPYVHGLVPFLALLLCHIYLLTDLKRRTFWISLLSIFSAFTGFAFVMNPLIVIIELLLLMQSGSKKWWHLFTTLVSGGSFAYVVLTNAVQAVPDLATGPWLALEYFAVLTANIFLVQAGGVDLLLAVLTILLAIALVILAMRRKRKELDKRKGTSVVILIGSALIFSLLNLYGRSQLSVENALASRYIPLGMCFAIGLYLLLFIVNNRVIRVAGILFLFVLLVRVHLKAEGRIEFAARRFAKFSQWEECLRSNPDYVHCREQVRTIDIYPVEGQDKELQQKLDFLRENNLNIYAD